MYTPTLVHSIHFRSRQGVSVRIDYILQNPDDQHVFYAGVYVEAPASKLPEDSEVRVILISLHPDGNKELEIKLRYVYRVGDRLTYSAPITGTIDRRYPGQIAIEINDEWQDDRWQPGHQHNFNFTWNPA